MTKFNERQMIENRPPKGVLNEDLLKTENLKPLLKRKSKLKKLHYFYIIKHFR